METCGTFGLETLCGAAIIRRGESIDRVMGSRVGRRLSELQQSFANASKWDMRTSGKLELVLATYERSTDVWKDPRCIRWMAVGDHLGYAMWGRLRHLASGVSRREIDRLFMLGSLCCPVSDCLREACRSLSMWCAYDDCSLMEWLILPHYSEEGVDERRGGADVDMRLAGYRADSLSYVCRSLGHSGLAHLASGSVVVMSELHRIRRILDLPLCIPFNAGHVFQWHAVWSRSWDAVRWLRDEGINIGLVYLACCMVQHAFDFVMLDASGQVDVTSVEFCKWAWRTCSPEALDWLLQHIPRVDKMWTSFEMAYATANKLRVLEGLGLKFPMKVGERALAACPVEVVEHILSMCRAWRPLQVAKILSGGSRVRSAPQKRAVLRGRLPTRGNRSSSVVRHPALCRDVAH